MADYFAHWLRMGTTIPKPPRIFHVNWFRQDEQGRFIWPGFGENLRVLEWILGRCREQAQAVESPIGLLPAPGAINTDGVDVDERTMRELLTVSTDDWRKEAENIGEFFAKFGDRLPAEMARRREALARRVG
jgi:phosphoenolpyruvate carboxykinase (GTP)